MKEYLLFMDVAGDVEPKCYEAGEVGFVPMEFLIDDEAMLYSIDKEKAGIDKEGFYAKVKADADIKTTQIAPALYEEYFAPYMEKGQSILYLCLSSGLSSTYNSALMAAKELKERFPECDLKPIDSLIATGGMGILMEKMIENKRAGMTIEENFDDIEGVKRQVGGYAYVDNLKSLKKGGRIGAGTAMIGTMLGIKPLIEINEGRLEVFAKAQGMKKALGRILEEYGKSFSQDKPVVYICDGCEDKQAEILAEGVKAINPSAQIRRTILSPIIGAHLGVGAVIICYYKG